MSFLDQYQDEALRAGDFVISQSELRNITNDAATNCHDGSMKRRQDPVGYLVRRCNELELADNFAFALRKKDRLHGKDVLAASLEENRAVRNTIGGIYHCAAQDFDQVFSELAGKVEQPLLVTWMYDRAQQLVCEAEDLAQLREALEVSRQGIMDVTPQCYMRLQVIDALAEKFAEYYAALRGEVVARAEV